MSDASPNSTTALSGQQIVLTSNNPASTGNYAGWTQLLVRNSLEELAGTFRFEITDQWDPLHFGTIPLRRGDAVNVSFVDDGGVIWPLITGFIDEKTLIYDKSSHTLGFSGRSITCDLVDCSLAAKTWSNSTLTQIATDILSQFSLSFFFGTGVVDGPPFPRYAVTDGDTAYNALEKLCRNRGFVMHTDGTGALIFDQVGTSTTSTSLVYGQNIMQCQSKNTVVDRFNSYVVKSQAGAGGSLGDKFYGSPVSAQKATATDPEIRRQRTLIVQAESGEVGSALQTRANWEASVRVAKGDRTTYTINGWEMSPGLGPWQPNTLVHVHDPLRRVDDNLLIISVALTRDMEGSHTQLEVCEPTAFSPQPLPVVFTPPTGYYDQR